MMAPLRLANANVPRRADTANVSMSDGIPRRIPGISTDQQAKGPRVAGLHLVSIHFVELE
jgi:hypothetical protein